MAPPMGYAGQFAIGASDPVDQRIKLKSETLKGSRLVLDPGDITGSASAEISTVRYGAYTYAGTIVCKPNAVELSYLLPWILGGTPSGTTYPLADTMVAKYVALKRVTDSFLYGGVQVGKATFSCDAGKPLEVALDLYALSETPGYAFPSLSLSTTTRPFILSDAVISVNSVAVCTTSITVVIDNMLTPAEFTNCTTGPEALIRTAPRDIRVGFTPAFAGDAAALYPPSEAGWATTITWTDGTVSLLMSFVKVVFDRESPTIADLASVIRLPLNGRAFKSGSTLELICTLDATV